MDTDRRVVFPFPPDKKSDSVVEVPARLRREAAALLVGGKASAAIPKGSLLDAECARQQRLRLRRERKRLAMQRKKVRLRAAGRCPK